MGKRASQKAIEGQPQEKDEEQTAKKKKTDAQSQGIQRSQMLTFYKRQATGYYVKASDQVKENAKLALATYPDLAGEEQADFLTNWKQSKNTKNFSFVKDFSDVLKSRKEVKEEVFEKYMSRTLAHMG